MKTEHTPGTHGTFCIAGEGPYCNWCGQNIKAQEERDRLRAVNAELVAALKNSERELNNAGPMLENWAYILGKRDPRKDEAARTFSENAMDLLPQMKTAAHQAALALARAALAKAKQP